MTPKAALRSTENTWFPMDAHHADERLTKAIKHLDTRFFITPWLDRMQSLINKHNR